MYYLNTLREKDRDSLYRPDNNIRPDGLINGDTNVVDVGRKCPLPLPVASSDETERTRLSVSRYRSFFFPITVF